LGFGFSLQAGLEKVGFVLLLIAILIAVSGMPVLISWSVKSILTRRRQRVGRGFEVKVPRRT
jgi:hypothetical protein